MGTQSLWDLFPFPPRSTGCHWVSHISDVLLAVGRNQERHWPRRMGRVKDAEPEPLKVAENLLERGTERTLEGGVGAVADCGGQTYTAEVA